MNNSLKSCLANNKKIKILYAFGLLLLLIAAFTGIIIGGTSLSISGIITAFSKGLSVTTEGKVFLYVRLPRTAASLICGAALAVSGAVIQCVLAGRSLSSLSGGMRQNAYIAMALAQDTDYILLDEPTSYLDISHQLELMKILKEFANLGKGVVAVLHDLPLAFAFSDSIAVLKDGAVAAVGSPHEIYKHPVIREVFGVELDYSEKEKSYRYKYSI